MPKKLIFCLFLLIFSCNFSYALEPWSGLTDTSVYNTGKKYFLHTGFAFDAVVRTGIFSFNLESPVIAEIEFDVIYLNKVMMPKGSKIIGYASVYKTDDRVNVFFHTIVFPDGNELKFQGLGLHTDGSAGIPGKVKKATYKVPAKAIFETLGNIALPGIGSAFAKGISDEALKEVDRYAPDYSVSVPKDTPILIYNIQRVEY